MARASDFEAVSRGLESIERSRVRRMMQEYQAAQDAEAKRRYDEQQARQLKLDADMGAFRTAQAKTQADAAAAAEAQRKFIRDRMTTQDAAKTAAAAEAQGRQTAFASEFGPAVAADPETNPTPFGETTGGMEPTPENILKAGVKTGALTPAQLADVALKNQALTAKATPEKSQTVFQETLEIPGFGKVPYTVSPTGQTKYWLPTKDKPSLSPAQFVAITKQMESYDKPIFEKQKEIMDSSPRDEATRKRLYSELGQLTLRRQAVERFMTSYLGGSGSEFEFEDKGKPAASPAPAGIPAQGKPAAGGNAEADRLLKEANDAIQKGADPAKVKERLKQLGVNVK